MVWICLPGHQPSDTWKVRKHGDMDVWSARKLLREFLHTISFLRVWKLVNGVVPAGRCFHDAQGKATEVKPAHYPAFKQVSAIYCVLVGPLILSHYYAMVGKNQWVLSFDVWNLKNFMISEARGTGSILFPLWKLWSLLPVTETCKYCSHSTI